VAKNDNFFTLIKSVNYLTRKDRLARSGRSFDNKSSVFGNLENKVSIISNDERSDGSEINVIDGNLSDVIPAPKIDGTQITIRDLFYNTPARKKFLKTPRTEARKIIETVKRFGLSCPDLGLSLVTDGKKIIDLIPETLGDRIGSLFDNTYPKNLIPIMISKADTKSFIFFQIEWSVIFVALTYLFIGKYGFVGVSISYFITYIIHFSLLNLYFRKLLWINKG